MTEAKLPNKTPGKTFDISASAAMPNDLPRWAERNRKIDALRLRSDRKTSGLSKLAPLDISSGVETSAFLRFPPKVRRLDPFIPRSPTGAITDSAPKVLCEPYPSNPKVRHNRSLVV